MMLSYSHQNLEQFDPIALDPSNIHSNNNRNTTKSNYSKKSSSSSSCHLLLNEICDLNCSFNALRFASDFQLLTQLIRLDISHNRICSLKLLPLRLRFLNVSHNELTTLDGCQSLMYLDTLLASHNQLADLDHVPASSAFRVIDASHNRLTTLKDLELCSSLVVVRVEHNLLRQPSDVAALERIRTLRVVALSSNVVCNRPEWARVLEKMLHRVEDYDCGSCSEGTSGHHQLQQQQQQQYQQHFALSLHERQNEKRREHIINNNNNNNYCNSRRFLSPDRSLPFEHLVTFSTTSSSSSLSHHDQLNVNSGKDFFQKIPAHLLVSSSFSSSPSAALEVSPKTPGTTIRDNERHLVMNEFSSTQHERNQNLVGKLSLIGASFVANNLSSALGKYPFFPPSSSSSSQKLADAVVDGGGNHKENLVMVDVEATTTNDANESEQNSFVSDEPHFLFRETTAMPLGSVRAGEFGRETPQETVAAAASPSSTAIPRSFYGYTVLHREAIPLSQRKEPNLEEIDQQISSDRKKTEKKSTSPSPKRPSHGNKNNNNNSNNNKAYASSNSTTKQPVPRRRSSVVTFASPSSKSQSFEKSNNNNTRSENIQQDKEEHDQQDNAETKQTHDDEERRRRNSFYFSTEGATIHMDAISRVANETRAIDQSVSHQTDHFFVPPANSLNGGKISLQHTSLSNHHRQHPVRNQKTENNVVLIHPTTQHIIKTETPVRHQDAKNSCIRQQQQAAAVGSLNLQSSLVPRATTTTTTPITTGMGVRHKKSVTEGKIKTLPYHERNKHVDAEIRLPVPLSEQEEKKYREFLRSEHEKQQQQQRQQQHHHHQIDQKNNNVSMQYLIQEAIRSETADEEDEAKRLREEKKKSDEQKIFQELEQERIRRQELEEEIRRMKEQQKVKDAADEEKNGNNAAEDATKKKEDNASRYTSSSSALPVKRRPSSALSSNAAAAAATVTPSTKILRSDVSNKIPAMTSAYRRRSSTAGGGNGSGVVSGTRGGGGTMHEMEVTSEALARADRILTSTATSQHHTSNAPERESQRQRKANAFWEKSVEGKLATKEMTKKRGEEEEDEEVQKQEQQKGEEGFQGVAGAPDKRHEKKQNQKQGNDEYSPISKRLLDARAKLQSTVDDAIFEMARGAAAAVVGERERANRKHIRRPTADDFGKMIQSLPSAPPPPFRASSSFASGTCAEKLQQYWVDARKVYSLQKSFEGNSMSRLQQQQPADIAELQRRTVEREKFVLAAEERDVIEKKKRRTEEAEKTRFSLQKKSIKFLEQQRRESGGKLGRSSSSASYQQVQHQQQQQVSDLDLSRNTDENFSGNKEEQQQRNSEMEIFLRTCENGGKENFRNDNQNESFGTAAHRLASCILSPMTPRI